jgi:hypothetical protein
MPNEPMTDERLAEMRERLLDEPYRIENAWLVGTVNELLAELDRQKALIDRLSGKFCLICGKPEPCQESPDACTFDPNPIEAAQAFQKRAEAAETELRQCRADKADIEYALKIAHEALVISQNYTTYSTGEAPIPAPKMTP